MARVYLSILSYNVSKYIIMVFYQLWVIVSEYYLSANIFFLCFHFRNCPSVPANSCIIVGFQDVSQRDEGFKNRNCH